MLDRLIKYSWVILILSLLLTAGSLYIAKDVKIFHDLEAFFPPGDPDWKFFNTYKKEFDIEENFQGIALKPRNGVFNQEFLLLADSVAEACKSLPYVEASISITNFNELVMNSFGPDFRPLIDLDKPQQFKADSVRIMNDERFVGNLVSRDGRSMMIALKLRPELEQSEMKEVSRATDELLKTFDLPEHHIAGWTRIITTVTDAIANEFFKYLLLCTAMAVLVMFILVQRLPGVAIALFAILVGLAWFGGVIGLSGRDLDLMSPLYPALLIVVGMSDVIHIISKYFDETGKGCPPREALKIAMKEIGLATLLTSVTTAIGFISLVTAQVPIVENFGLFTAIGVILMYLATVGMLLALIPRVRPEKLMNLKMHGGMWTGILDRWHGAVTRNTGMVLGIFAVIIVLSAWGMTRINFTTYMVDDVPREDRLLEDFKFFETHYAGVRPFEIAVLPAEGRRVDELAVLKEIDKLNEWLKKEHNFGPLQNPTIIFKTLRMANHKGDPAFYSLPEEDREHKKLRRQFSLADKNLTKLVISKDYRFGRIQGNVPDPGSTKMSEVEQSVSAWTEEHIDRSVVDFRVTGAEVMVDRYHGYIRKNLVTGLGIAFIAIALIMGLLFRNVKMVIIALIPNLIPIVIAAGIIGWTGIALNGTTAIIFTVAFGIAVDDTIHFLTKFKFQMAKGMKIEEAIHTTFLETGKALILTTLILFSGFVVLLSSQLQSITNIGFLISVTLFSALICDLSLLLVLLRMGLKEKK